MVLTLFFRNYKVNQYPYLLCFVLYLAEELVITAVQWLRLAVETMGAVMVALGCTLALYHFVRMLISGQTSTFNPVRLILARYLALALEFQLGADILSTAVSPSWDQLGKLAAIAVLRTGLNYFLSREMDEEKRTMENEKAVVRRGKASVNPPKSG